jgi:hypothetical protein
MIPPAVDVHGDVLDVPDLWRDVRVPRPLSWDGNPAHLLAGWRRTDQCPDGRHMWDALVAQEQITDAAVLGALSPGDEYAEALRFRLTLTCLRCGVIERLAGVRQEERGESSGQVDPVPLKAGTLRAQQVDTSGRHAVRGHELAVYVVHRGSAAEPVGSIAWGRGPRGRRYFAGRLHSWPAGQGVEASSALACLRKLADGGESRG